MPPVIPNQDGWLAAQIAQLKRDVAALKAQQTQYVVDAAGVTRAIIGNLATDPSGNSTGLSGFGIAALVGGVWTPDGNQVVAVSHAFSAQSSVSATFSHSLGRVPRIVLPIATNSIAIGYEYTAATSTTFSVTCFTTSSTTISATITGLALIT